MKKILDWEAKEVVDIFDEVTLWSAPFGKLLLENIPMKVGATIVDIGFGTGFPLVELGQRFGNSSKVYGIDIWKEGIDKAREKIETLELSNIQILEENAAKIDIADGQIDLVTSNLGVNNFDQREEVYAEIRRILKPAGRLCITTNPVGTFEELFALFKEVFEELNLQEELSGLNESIQQRSTEKAIIAEFKSHGMTLVKNIADSTNIRFADAGALLDHSLIRIGFRQYWEEMVREKYRQPFFKRLSAKINEVIQLNGEFKTKIPMLYLEFEKM